MWILLIKKELIVSLFMQWYNKQKEREVCHMGIKGKTTFELTDVNTSKVEVIEDSNMITNGLQEFLRTYGYFGCDILNTDTIRNSSLWVNLLGGLFLFDTALDEDVNNTFMPAGVKMIGNGSKDISNSGAVTELGSYNTTESGLQSDGSIKFVYDFSTAQANGTIACACLTSRIGGYMGMGNDSARYYSDNYDLRTFWSDSYHECISGIDGAGNDVSHILYPVYSENAIYFTNPYNINYSSSYASQHWSVTKKIQILKVRAGFTGVSIKNSKYLKQVIATYDVDIPQDILDYMGTSTNYIFISRDSEMNVYIIFSKSSYEQLSSGAFCWIMKIDKNMKATAYKFTNNTGITLYIELSRITFDGDYLWMYAYNSPYYLYGIKYSDSTQIIETGVSKDGKYNLYTVEKNLIGIYDKPYANLYCAPTVYDVVNRTHRQVNGRMYSNSCMLIPFPDKKGVYLYVDYSSRSSTDPCNLKVMKDPRYLATINNLTEPVVKTSSKTMKVTYTLTFEG